MVLESKPAERDTKVYPEAIPTTSYSNLPEVHHGQDHIAQHGLYPSEQAVYTQNKEVAAISPDTSKKRLCGLRRRVAIGLMVAVILIAAVIGGTVGGVLGNKNKTHQPIPSPSPSPSNASAPNSTTGLVLAPEPMRNIVATNVNTGTIIIVWQKANGELWTHTYFKSGNKNTWKWTDPVKLGNDIPAVNNTPIAAAAWLAGGKFEFRVHFQVQSSQSLSSVELSCYANTTLCGLPTTKPISNSTALTPGAGFFMLAPSANDLRYYTINTDGLVTEASYNSKTRVWAAPRPIGDTAKAHKASPIAAGLVGDEIWVYWFDEAKRLQSATSAWKSQTWSQVEPVALAPVPAQLPRALGIGVSDQQVVQVFFFDGTKVQQVRWSNAKWTVGDTGAGVPDAKIPNGPLGMIGFPTTVRLYYPIDEARKIVEVNGPGEWSVETTQEVDYD